ncbi:MAG: hypothetical protein M0017_01675 [Desulfobacteraceae bacterium]|nr:hypothetical protein [Desulfobacteraceae bacterium]
MRNAQIDNRIDREEKLKEFFAAVGFLGIYDDVPNGEVARTAARRSRTIIGALQWSKRFFTMDMTPPSRETIEKIARSEGLSFSSLERAA